jgi:hypothetical protein
MDFVSSPDHQRWFRIDLHIHTPASEDYAESDATFLDILHEAERRGLDIVALTDHNTVAGYERMQRDVDFLQQLVRSNRATPDEQRQLAEFQRLLQRLCVLPGFEFTSHYGAHVLGVFAPSTPIGLIEATLLQLGVPAEKLKAGTTSLPNTKHVTDAYEVIAKAGGIVVAAHVNGPAGVVYETLRMNTSGQARVAATQSPFVHALEFVNFYTDHGTFTSPSFFNGKTEHYERPMFCIQSSDAHRVRRAPSGTDATHKHGVGDRYFEALLPEPSFEALQALFQTQAFERVRVPKRDQKQWEVDQLRFGQETDRQVLRGQTDNIGLLVHDIAALGNVGGGTLVVGANEPVPGRVEGVANPHQLATQLRAAVEHDIDPAPVLSLELLRYEGRDVMRIEVSAADVPPYVTRDGVIYMRRDAQTVPANRGEIIQLARRALVGGATSPLDNGADLDLPRSGVEVVGAERRNGEWLYEIRDLRTTVGVSREHAQGLWQYAVSRHEDVREKRVDVYAQVRWVGRLGLLRAYQQGGRVKYDLVHRDANGVIDHIFYGVSDWGLSDAWSAVVTSVPAVEQDGVPPADQQEDEPVVLEAATPVDEHAAGSLPVGDAPGFGGRRWRWYGRGGIWRIRRAADGMPRFDLALRTNGAPPQEHFDVPRERLNDKWLRFIRVMPPRTGIEVVNDTQDEAGNRLVTFRDLRTGEISAPWHAEDLKEGSVREYAARMHSVDVSLDEGMVRWWGNIGYLRPMRSQVDLVYRDEHGVDHVYYAARREELRDQWAELLVHWEADANINNRSNSMERPDAAYRSGERSDAATTARARTGAPGWNRMPHAPPSMLGVDAHRERHGRNGAALEQRWTADASPADQEDVAQPINDPR